MTTAEAVGYTVAAVYPTLELVVGAAEYPVAALALYAGTVPLLALPVGYTARVRVLATDGLLLLMGTTTAGAELGVLSEPPAG